MGCVCECGKQWYLAWMSTCSGCLGMVCSTLLLWLSCSIAQVTAKGSERKGKNGKVKGGEVSSFMSEQCQAGEERGMM